MRPSRTRHLLDGLVVGVLLLVGGLLLSGFLVRGAVTAGPSGHRIEIKGVTFIEILPAERRGGRPDGPGPDAPFWIAETEVTNAQYEQFDRRHRRSRLSGGDDDPVVNVDWYEARGYCSWLSLHGGLKVRLPTEEEWEFACRAGSDGAYCFGDDRDRLGGHAWYLVNSRARAHPVKSRRPNAWGLFDMHGNVLEWCEDIWSPRPTVPGLTEKVGDASSLTARVVRGGGWLYSAEHCQSSYRVRMDTLVWGPSLGFRPAASAR